MNWLTNQYPLVKEYLLQSAPNHWAEFVQLVNERWPTNQLISPEVIIPLATCKAVGGNPEKAVPIVAGLMPVLYSVRILDDLQDRDKEGLWNQVGPERAFNFAYTFQALGYKILGDLPYAPKLNKTIYNTFLDGAFLTLKGQDRDLKNLNTTWDNYWKTAELKTAFITSTASAMGAMTGTAAKKKIKACRVYGYHWGMALQILNDLDGIWNTEGITDLEQGKVTLPIIYALNCDHPHRKELYHLVANQAIKANKERILEILNIVDAKSFLIWAALKEREKAIDALSTCNDQEGVQILDSYITGMFGDIQELLDKKDIEQEENFIKFYRRDLLRKKTNNTKKAIVLDSKSLAMRASLRKVLTN